jgi:pseudouridine kinase
MIEKNILVIGAAGVDVVGRLEDDLQMGTSNPARIRTSYGGVARNVAENLARFGLPVSLLTVIGTDLPGDDVLAHTANAGVDVSHVLRVADYPTGFYMGLLNQRGERQLALDDMRIVSTITPEYIEQHAELFYESSMLFLDANLPTQTLKTAIRLAQDADIPICADPTSSKLARGLKPHLKKIHLITPNAAECETLTGLTFDPSDRTSALEAARALVNAGVKLAVITLAAFGVCYATSETSGHIPAIRTRITDPTGAGDALTAAVLFGLSQNMDPDEVVRLGVAAASLTLRYPGTVHNELSLERLYDEL